MSDSTREVKDEHVKAPNSGTGPLKAFRYEDVQVGVPPVTVKTGSAPRSPVPSPKSDQIARPRTSPSPTTQASPLLALDFKRDSAVAPSVSTATRTSYAESHHSSVAGGAAREPSLPKILVQDGEPAPSAERSRSQERSGKKQIKARSASPPTQVQRNSSFRGLDSPIPNGRLDDINLEDLGTDKVAFSKRGSLLYRGKRMNRASATPVGLGMDGVSTHAEEDESTKGDSRPASGASQEAEAPKSGLVAGRRKPSVQMLQAALQGGRVLSAEEMTFSMKVRSMYEYGNEKGQSWGSTNRNGTPSTGISESIRGQSNASEVGIDGVLKADSSPSSLQQHPAFRDPSSSIRASYMKEHNELAGGIEDWDDVNGEDVDRYGFISPKSNPNRNSVLAGVPGEGMQRVATSLRFEAEQPRRHRKLRRNPSAATRSSRSVPPQAQRGDPRSGGSVRSFRSSKSSNHHHSANPFQSRSRRTVADASDMLTLPPGLEDIHEQEDAGRTASMLKRREWAREQKWQKMARPVKGNQSANGAGMQFTFDTTDPKVISRTWKGIPDRWRATAWHSYLSASAQRRNAAKTDAELITQFHALQEQSSADDVQIDMDVPRTISMHIMFRRRYRGGQRLLFHVLHAISLFFPDTGYVQGMASLAATLLCYYDEEHAFVMMVRLWQLRGLEQLYRAGFQGMMDALKEFEDDWLSTGDVAQKLEDLGITSTAYGTRWYLTLFNMSVPFPAQLRVWDVFMLLGDSGPGETQLFDGADLDVLHATSAALIDATREIIIDSDFENAMKVLTSFVPIRDEDLLMRVAKAEWKMRKKRGGMIGR